MPSYKRQLDQARQDVKQVQQRIEGQTDLIGLLRTDGYSTGSAEHLLVVYLELREGADLASGKLGTGCRGTFANRKLKKRSRPPSTLRE
jgi:hypothetical protein